MGKTKDRSFTDDEYCIIVLRTLRRVARRSNWLIETVPPRSIDDDEPNSREIVEVLDYAVNAVRAMRELND